MTIDKKINFNINQVCKELGIQKHALVSLINSKYTSSIKGDIPSSPLALDIIPQFKKNQQELVKNNKRSKETWKTYKNFLDRLTILIKEKNPDMKINELTEVLIIELLSKSKPKKDEKLSVRTVNKYYSIMRKLLSFAYEMDYTNKNLKYRFELQKSELLPRYIKDENIKEILIAAKELHKGYRARAILVFLLGTGCRLSEVANVKVKDFDIENDLLYVLGKGNKDRYIPIFPEIKPEIMKYLHQSGLENWTPDSDGYLFSMDEGNERQIPISIRSIGRIIEDIRRELEHLPYISIHSFRHTFAVKCLSSGISLHNLSLILGHTDPKTTMVYTQLFNDDLKKEINKNYPFPFQKLLEHIINDGEKDD
ncbi:tyrosine-type recombinase/integrase [Pontibacillus yanchengensis]|uniref:Integrase n=1 Tax=Pontibacillus yanchengensis Y32 TaxID=1385514 RepID=A0A0A2TH13_9BACI|nr:site-specific integrase [Pontibacillus yanchengensis]KGP73748.1 hypothetical protein N782_02300 [Pontibacillus yanchengensis Y32]